ncbi:MAG: Uma2 family endonuclease [Bacteroidales bacterium]|nr:Uma2 family endonuclease [Bacteroidales bacterium]
MESVNIDFNKRYTFADYLGWLDDKRRELIGGFVKMMTPAPSRKHQRVSGQIYGQLWEQLRKNKCEVYHAPFDVRFPSVNGETADNKIFTVVQPDVSIICDKSKLDERGCLGAPDLIIEIISPATAKKDVEEKFKLYEENGVREYWIIHPNDETATVFMLENNKYKLQGIFAKDSKIIIGIFEGKMRIDLGEVFDD